VTLQQVPDADAAGTGIASPGEMQPFLNGGLENGLAVGGAECQVLWVEGDGVRHFVWVPKLFLSGTGFASCRLAFGYPVLLELPGGGATRAARSDTRHLFSGQFCDARLRKMTRNLYQT